MAEFLLESRSFLPLPIRYSVRLASCRPVLVALSHAWLVWSSLKYVAYQHAAAVVVGVYVPSAPA